MSLGIIFDCTYSSNIVSSQKLYNQIKPDMILLENDIISKEHNNDTLNNNITVSQTTEYHDGYYQSCITPTELE